MLFKDNDPNIEQYYRKLYWFINNIASMNPDIISPNINNLVLLFSMCFNRGIELLDVGNYTCPISILSKLGWEWTQKGKNCEISKRYILHAFKLFIHKLDIKHLNKNQRLVGGKLKITLKTFALVNNRLMTTGNKYLSRDMLNDIIRRLIHIYAWQNFSNSCGEYDRAEKLPKKKLRQIACDMQIPFDTFRHSDNQIKTSIIRKKVNTELWLWDVQNTLFQHENLTNIRKLCERRGYLNLPKIGKGAKKKYALHIYNEMTRIKGKKPTIQQLLNFRKTLKTINKPVVIDHDDDDYSA